MTTALDLKVDRVPLDSLQPWPGNPRTHDLDLLRDSLKRHGQYRPLVVQASTRQIVAGNGTWEAAKAEGWAEVAASLLELDDEQARRILLVDNRSSDLAGYDDPALLELLKGLPDLGGTGWDQAALDGLLAQLAPTQEGLTDPDEVPEPPAEPVSQAGNLWLLGEHRLLCGDSTRPEHVMLLMGGDVAELAACDPPYNVGETYASYEDVLSDDGYTSFTGAWFAECQAHSERQVVTPGWNNLVAWCRLFVPYFIACWTKSNSMTSGKVSRWTCWEPLLFFGAGWKTDGQRPSDLFDFPIGEQKGVGGHPCPKPAAFWVDLLENYSRRGSVVLDLFGGSGTTMIAAQRTGRRARLLELDSTYCDVICRRFQEFTGTIPILESTGEEHDFTAA